MVGNTPSDIHHDAVKKLEDKSELQRHMHSISARRYRNKIDAIVYSTILLSIVISFFSIADPSLLGLQTSDMVWISRVIAISSIVILFLSISDRLFGLGEKKASHEQAVQLLTDFIRECNQCRHVELKNPNLSDVEKDRVVDETRQEYSKITHIMPDSGVSDEEFVIEKQIHKIKVDLSRVIDANHNMDNSEGLKKIGQLRRQRRKIRILQLFKLR